MREGLLFVPNTLVGACLREKINVGLSGKIVSAFDIASILVIGAWANAARGVYNFHRLTLISPADAEGPV